MQSTPKDNTVKTSEATGITSANLCTFNLQSVRRPMYHSIGFLSYKCARHLYYMLFFIFVNSASK